MSSKSVKKLPNATYPELPVKTTQCVVHSLLLLLLVVACLLMLCFAKGTAKGPAKMVACLLCFGSLSFASVLLKHAMVANASGSGCLLYKLVCLKFNSLSKYHAEPPTLTRLGASADFLSIELK